MKKIQFTISGNHKDPVGNAVPKLKMTGRQHWMAKAQEYVQWKRHVVFSFLDSLDQKKEYEAHRIAESNIVKFGKPIVLSEGQNAKMTLWIEWKDEKHCDPENCFGAIADALFFNDKHLDGEFHANHSKEKKGSVEVIINII